MADSQALTPVSPQVSLDAIFSAVAGLFTELVAACRSDNVQPIAVVACRALGDRLPRMCSTTSMAISKLATKNGDYRIELLGVAIGFRPMDVARQLANDEAGLRFLVVAAALLSLGSPFNAAESLHLLLSRTFPTANQLPTLHELRDLFIALQRHFDCSDFGTYVLGWKTLLDRAMPPTQVTELQPDQSVFDSSTGLGSAAQTMTSQRQSTEFDDGVHHGLGRGPVTLQHVTQEGNGDTATGANAVEPTPTASSSLVLSRGPIPVEVSAANERIASIRGAMEALQTSSPEASESFLERTGVARFGVQSVSTGSWNALFSRDQEGTVGTRYKHPDEQDVEDPESQHFSDPVGRYPPLQCPSSSQICALLRAMNELHGTGGVTLASIRTPRTTAAWIIAFIRWCFGAEPTVYCVQREAAITVQKQSNIIVEVDENSKSAIMVQTFTSINGIHHLFNSTVALTVAEHSRPFQAMVKIKSHFLWRLSALRPYYEISQAIDYLLHLASAIGSLGDSGHRLRSLPSSELLLGLVGDYFDVDDCKQRLRSADLESIKHLDTTRLSELFEEILYSSQIRNLFEHRTSDLYVVAGQHHLTGLDPELSIAKVIDRNFHEGSPIEYEKVLSPPRLDQGVLRLLGYSFEVAKSMTPDHTVAATERGQVQYLSFLEAFDFDNGFRLAFRSRNVAPGSIVYKEDNWSRVFSDCGPTYITPMEVRTQPLTLTGTSQRHRFMIERRDGFLSMHWQPQVKPSPRVDNVNLCLHSLSQFGVCLDKHENNCSCGEIVTVDGLPNINYCSTLADIRPNLDIRDGILESSMVNVVPGVGTQGSDIYFSAGMLCNVTIRGPLAYHSAYLSRGCLYCAHLNAEAQLTRSMDSSLLQIPRFKHALVITTSQSREEVEKTVSEMRKEIAERAAADAMELDDEHAEPELGQIEDLVDPLGFQEGEHDEAEVVEVEP